MDTHTSTSRSLRPKLHSRTSSRVIPSQPQTASSFADTAAQPPPQHKHKHSRHHSSHHTHLRVHSSARAHAKETLSSAIQPPSFGDLLKQARGKEASPSHSRKGSEAVVGIDGAVAAKEEAVQHQIGVEDVVRERKRVEAMRSDISTTLAHLSETSLSTSRHLDDTYYTILERLSELRHTIAQLQDLSNLTRELHASFDDDAAELIDDVRGQVGDFGDFEEQEGQIGLLEQRVREGRRKAEELGERLGRAREQVDGWAKREVEAEGRNARRRRLFFMLLLSLIVAFLSLSLFQRNKPASPPTPYWTIGDIDRARIERAEMPKEVKENLLTPVLDNHGKDKRRGKVESDEVKEDAGLWDNIQGQMRIPKKADGKDGLEDRR